MPNINAQSKKHLIPLFNLFPKAASISVTFVGFVVLIGWIFNIPTLKSISPGLVTMKANTAVAFILAGISLWILCKQKIGGRVRFIAKSCATVVALIGLLTLTEYIFGWELGIDQLLFRESAEVVGTSHPGRMAPTTALNFFLLGSALILLDMPFGFQPSQFFAILGSFIGLLNLVGYTYGVKKLYGILSYTQMALHTSVTFLVLSIGILFIRSDRGVAAIITNNNIGSNVARRMIPFAIGIPLILGWLRLLGEKAGLYSTEFGVSLTVIFSIVIFIFIILRNANSLNEVDIKRKKAEEALQKSHDELEIRVQERTSELSKTTEELQAEISQHKRAEETLRIKDSAIDSSINGIVISNLEGYLTYANQSFLKMWGYDKKEVLGKHILKFCQKEKEVSEVIEALQDEGWVGETKARRKDGSLFDVSFSASMVKDKDGNPMCMMGSFIDVTERKKMEESLQESEERFKGAFETAAIGMALVALDGHWMKVNLSLSNIVGYSEQELMDKTFQDITHPDDLEKDLTYVKRLIAGDIPYYHMEKRYFHKQGHIVWIYLSVSLVHDTQGNPLYFVSQIEDITERKKAEEKIKEYTETLEEKIKERTGELQNANLELQALNKELELRKQEAEAATRAKSDFLANMSHELRTPLNAIIGFSQIMTEGMAGPLNEQQKEYLGDISESGTHLLSLINDILDLSKVEAGKMELELSEFNLRELIDGSIVMFKEKAMKHNIKVKVEVREGIETIIADERKIKQVMFNLLSNAFKFTPDGGSVKVTALKIVGEPEYIECVVEDTGIGIKEEDIPKLFQPFQQLESVLSKKYEGTGLGLVLCKRFVELHGGKIWVESELDKGSTFRFIIPKVKQPVEQIVDPVTKLLTWKRALIHMGRIFSLHKRRGRPFGLLRIEFTRLDKPEEHLSIAKILKNVIRKHEILSHCKDWGCYHLILFYADRRVADDAALRITAVLKEAGYNPIIKTAIYMEDGENIEELLKALSS